MKTEMVSIAKSVVVAIAIVVLSGTALAQTTAFKYQGQLNSGGTPANGNYEMQFKLFDALNAGAQVGATVTNASVTVINGFFSTTLDFGAAPFDPGPNRWLELSVRPVGSPNPIVLLSPRQPITSAPYAIQARNSLTADNATNALQLGGVDASEYVTAASAGNQFIRNSAAVQPTSNFNVSGNGQIGGALGIGITPLAGFKLDVNGPALVRTTGTGGNIQLGNPAGETGMTISGVNRADIRYDGSALRLFAGTGTGIPTTGLLITNQGNAGTSGSLGVGTFNPDTRLTLDGGPLWTFQGWKASMNLRNFTAIGWDANNSGQRWGIGQQTGGLHFFRTFSAFGSNISNAEYSMVITDTGNITQERNRGGLVKAMIAVNANGTIARCYNSVANTSSGNCGFVVTPGAIGLYELDFGFQVNDRFVVATPHKGGGGTPIGVNYEFVNTTVISIETFITNVDTPGRSTNPFMIIIY